MKLTRNITELYKNTLGWFKSIYIVFLSTKDKPYVFYGYGHFNLSRMYADKRHKRNGKRYYVIPVRSEGQELAVINSVEKKILQRRWVLSKRLSVNDLLHHAYYVTKK